MKTLGRCGLFVWLTVAGLFVAGCGSDSAKADRQKVTPVTGTVTYKNQPVAGATVTFRGDGKILPAVALTDAAGKFKCTTYDAGDGAIPGEHSVTVTKSVSNGPELPKPGVDGHKQMENAMLRGQRGENVPSTVHLVPEKYAEPASSPLHFTVKDGEPNDFNIELTD
jgi:hypothetical protein